MLQVRLLGQFDVRTEGKRVTIPSRAGQSLLAYLALTAGTAHRREKLAGTFWPDTTDETARKNLRQELWRIRKAISAGQPAENEYLLADEYTLKFNRDAEYWLDVSQMERPDLDLQSLIANLSLYQGELLPGFYDEWITLERERIQAVFEARMEQLLEQLITAERWIALQEWGERWLSLSGVREPAYRALMLASGVRGDMAKVASLYQRCTRELMEQLGLEPSPETRALYDGLLKGAKVPLRTAAQPAGTITFLFTDIEGSTRLLDKMGDQYAVVLGEHHEILRAAIQRWNGREVDTQGDAFFVTFTRAIDAVQCAAEAQRALAAHSWHQAESIRIRMGLHTGEPLIASTGYVGMDVHRAARIGDAGHGGQILLSQTTRELVIQDLPEGMTIQDLGEHRLKDLKYPTSIYQLVVDGLPADFAPIRTKFTGSEAPTPGEAPFKGLQFFDEGDSDLFFGRETLAAKLIKRLHDANFLSVIIGASGSGKSSLVRAGLVPAIKKGNKLINGTRPPKGSANWQVHIITPTAHPLKALAIELTRDSESVTAAATLVDDLSKDPRSLHFFLSRQAQTFDSSHILLVIDQFEELFTLCRDNFEREAFIDNLLTALTPVPLPLGEARKGEGNITLIITLRADFYAHLAQYPELRDAVAQQQEYIGPMTAEELRRAIEEPAKRGHWEFEPGLVDLILRDVGDEPGALPLLSHALLETWKRRAGHMLTLKGYADAGGVHGAIAHTAESVYQNLSLSEQTIVRNILLRLTEFGEGTEDTRRRASFDELMSHTEDADEVRAVLNRLAEARLVTLSEDSAEVAHEALIREWPKLREWLSQDREGIILHRHLTEAAHEWELLERDAGSVYRGARLAQANEWSVLNPKALNAQERLFLDASNTQAKREEQEREDQLQRELASAIELAETQRQSVSRLRIRNRLITIVGAIAIILALTAAVFSQRANQQSHLSASRELAAASISNLDVDPERSILLALEALDSSYTTEAEDALHRAVQSSRVQLVIPAHEPGSPMNVDFSSDMNVDFSPDGKRFVTGSANDQFVKVWDAVTGDLMLQVAGQFAVYSPDGKRIASVVADGTVKMWDASTGSEIRVPGQIDAGIGVDFSPDGARLATVASTNVPKIWDAKTGRELVAFPGHEDFVAVALFSPDGTRLLTTSDDGTARVWNSRTGEQLLVLSDSQGWVWSGAFSPDGKRIATTGGVNGNNIYIWDAETGERLFTIAGHTAPLNSVSFSPDGARLATSGTDHKAIVWDAFTGKVLFILAGHTGDIRGVDFSPDGMHLATSSTDGTVRLWDITPSRELFTFFTPTDSSSQFAFNADGSRLATSDEEGTVIIWDATSGKEVQSLSNPAGLILDLTFSQDGKRLVIVNDDTKVRIWDISTDNELDVISDHTSTVNGIAITKDGTLLATASDDHKAMIWDISKTPSKLLFTLDHPSEVRSSIAFSPDGTWLATGVYDGTAKLWDVTTGKEILTLRGHTGAVWAVAFSPDGTHIATASLDATAKIWNAATGEELFTLHGHSSLVTSIAYSPDGKRIATASRDGTAKIWDAQTGQELLTIYGDGIGLNEVAFSPDGKWLATGGDRGVQVYLLQIDDLIALAQSRVTRTLTSEECQKFLHLDALTCAPETAIPTTTPIPPIDQGRVCQVTNTEGLYDNSFNEMIYTGLQDSNDMFGWDVKVLQSAALSDFEKNIAEFQRGDCDLIVGVFPMSDAIRAAAEKNPNQKFQSMNLSYEQPLDNVWTQMHAPDQAAFLAGYAAASVTKTGKVGVFGGIDIPPVTDFMDGFAFGVRYYNEKNGTNVEVLGWNPEKHEGVFVGGFCCTIDGRQIAQQLLDQGADIILPAAGIGPGMGAAYAVKTNGNAYIIGADTDWAVTFPEHADIVLTSVMKNLDVSVVQAVQAIENGTFTGGIHIGTLETGEMGLAPFHNLDSLISAKVKGELEQIKADIIAGKIKTKP